MPFFRVRVRKTLDRFVFVQADSTSAAENIALSYETNPPIEVISGNVVAGFPTYNVVSSVKITDPANVSELSKLYIVNLAGKAQETLETIAINSTNTNITEAEFYLLREHIDELEATIEVILT